ncbi:hypothetical protein ACTD5D_21980 [Nocardia takedensis]|uniref:hypothetical protein n=1 Tax=Nocardia takedensis TaxID=259390 RepID=UPI003F7632A8
MPERNRKKKAKTRSTSPAPQLAPQVFSELNAIFYSRDAGQEFLDRIEHLSLLACPDEDLAEVYRKPRTIGCMTLGTDRAPSRETRERLLQSEALMTFHHAAETLLRSYFAHAAPDERCPWMMMAKELNFAEFKNRVANLLKAPSGQISDTVARVFLGGTDPRDAGVALPDDEFNDAAEAYLQILRHCGRRFLSESYAYNAAKHGSANLDLDLTKLQLTSTGGPSIPLHDGAMITYLSREEVSSAKPGDPPVRAWCHNLEPALTDYNLASATLAARGISAISNVGRRRYTGQSGSVVVMTPKQVALAQFAPIIEAGTHVSRMTFQLPTTNDDGSFEPIAGQLSGFQRPKLFDPEEEMPPTKRVNLVVRQRDRRLLIRGSRYLLPVSPRGSQSV